MGLRLGLGVLHDYNKLRADTQTKNILAWSPVVAEILEGFCEFDDKAVSTPFSPESIIHAIFQFARYTPAIYPLAAELLTRDLVPEIRQALKKYFLRVGYTQGIVEA